MPRRLVIGAWLLVIVWSLGFGDWLFPQAIALACPMCKEALFDPAQSAAQSRVAQGYAVSVATLLGTPLLLVGGLTALIVRAIHRAKKL